VSPRRGEVHRLAGRQAGILVLTNDTWNRLMGSVGGVLVAAAGSDPLAVALPGFGGVALCAVLLAIPLRLLGRLEHVAAAAELTEIAEAVRGLLGHPGLLSSPPEAPPRPPGPVTYPAWGQVYYGPPIGGESKRYVVVSHDLHNRSTGRPAVVRTTSRHKRDHRSFPAIRAGARACCGDAATVAERDLRCRPGDGRPEPPSLTLLDMVAIAHGMAETHGI
jgi:mRNA-degrading endonuclease toxin of MazEF toxin-antitoxin module